MVRLRGVVAGLLAGTLVGLSAPLGGAAVVTAAASPSTGVTGPFTGPPAAPAPVDLRALKPGGGKHSQKSFRHPQGQTQLDAEKADAQSLGPQEGIQTSASKATSPVVPSPSAPAGWIGITDAESYCNCHPPDGSIAVSSTSVLAAVNSSFKAWDWNGIVIQPATSIGSLFAANASCLPNVSDPSVEYDGAADRFLLEAMTYDSRYNTVICFGVSPIGSVSGTWNVYAFQVTPSQNLLDYPHIAIGLNAIYLGGNQFQNGTRFVGGRVYAYDKNAMFAGLLAGQLYRDVLTNGVGTAADTPYPVRGLEKADQAYFVAPDNSGPTGSTISVWKWDKNPFQTGSTFALKGAAPVTTFSQPVAATELGGGTIDTMDAREMGAYWSKDGTIYGAHNITCNPGGGAVTCVQWYQLATVDSLPSTRLQGVIGGNNQYRFDPNLTVDSAGNFTIAYAYSSTTEYPGIRYAGKSATYAGTNPPLDAPESVMQAGDGWIDGTRYGDFSGQSLAPDGCTVWHFEEFAKTGTLWATFAGQVRFSSCGATPPPQPPGVPTGVTASGGDSQATVNWSPPVSDGGSAITGYTVTIYLGCCWGGTSVAVGGSARSYTWTGLSNGWRWSFHVSATNSVGVGPEAASNTVMVAGAPGPPTLVTASPGTGEATVSWSPPTSDGGSAITGYTVTIYLGCCWRGISVAVGGAARSYTWSGLGSGFPWTFHVSATNSAGIMGPEAVSNTVMPR